MSRHRLIIVACLLVALAYAGKDVSVVVEFWFHGIDAWTALFRPFPEWGEGAELYGALLPAKWIGTRTMWYAGALFAVLFFSLLFRTYKLVAVFLFEGALIELLDATWLLIGQYYWDWSTPATSGAVATALVIAAILLLSGWYLFRSEPPAWASASHSL